MAVLFFDNFGGYALADAGAVWGGYSQVPTIVTSGGRNNGPYANIPSAGVASHFISRAFTPSATWVFGFAVHVVTSFSANLLIAGLYDAGTVQLTLNINTDGTLSVFRGTSTAVTDGTSVLAMAPDVWYYIEMKVTIADSISAGTCEVRVNGVTWITVATGQDLKSTTNATANQLKFGKNSSTGGNSRLTDIYIDNGTTFLGDCTVSTLTVSGAGTTNTLTTGTFADVDDTTNDGDTTYAESAVNGHLATFAMNNLSGTPTTIHAVAPWNLIRKTDGGLKTARSVIRSGGANYGQTDFNATDSYLYNTPITIVDPATAAAWLAAGVNAIEAGFEVRS